LAFAPLVTLCEPLPTLMPGLTSAPMLALELLMPTFASTPTLGFTLSVRDSPRVGLADWELLEGAAEPFKLMSVERDELTPGADAVPFRLMSVEDEVPPAIAAPGAVSTVVLADVPPSGALGTQPPGVVLAVSMHFGSRRSLGTVTDVMVSARATPNAASRAALRRLMRKIGRCIFLPPGWDFRALRLVWQPGPRRVARRGPPEPEASWSMVRLDHFLPSLLQMEYAHPTML
jgi:hypothetical protein